MSSPIIPVRDTVVPADASRAAVQLPARNDPGTVGQAGGTSADFTARYNADAEARAQRDQQARLEQATELGLALEIDRFAPGAGKPAARFLASTELGRGISSGVMAAEEAVVKNTVGTGATIVEGARRALNAWQAWGRGTNSTLGDDIVGGDFIEWYNDPNSGPQNLDPIPDEVQAAVEPRTMFGQLTKGLTQWGIGFLVARKVLPVSAGAGTLATVGTVVGQQAVVNAGFVDPWESRLSNFIQTTGMANRFHAMMQADPSDSFAEAKVKQMVEGLLLDSALEGMAGLWAFAAQRAAKAGLESEAKRMAEKALAYAQQAQEAEATKAAKVVMDNGQPAVEVRFPENAPVRTPQEQIAHLEGELRGAQRELETDALTGLGSQRAWLRAKAAAEADPNTVIISFDLNNFKGLNDALGHAQGDEILKRVGATISAVTDRGFRTGGDEFVVIAPKGQADRLRQTIEDLFGVKEFSTKEGQRFAASISGTAGNTFQEADDLLQAAKSARKAATGGTAPRIPSSSTADAEATAAALNHTVEVLQRPRGIAALDAPAMDALRNAARAARGVTRGGALDDIFSQYIGNLNLSYLQTPEESNALFEAIYGVFKEELNVAQGARSLADSRATAVRLLEGSGVGNAVEMVQQWAAQSVDAEARALATRFFTAAQGRQVSILSSFADMHPDNALAYDALAKAMDYLVRTQEALSTITGSAGRTLRIFQEKVTGAELDIAGGTIRKGDDAAVAAERAAGDAAQQGSEAAAARIYAGMTKRQIQSLARYIRFANGNPDIIRQILKVTQELPKHAGNPTAMQQLVRWRMNFLLSGPKTHLANVLSNVVTAFQLPAEYWWAGVRYGDRESFQKGTETMVGLFTEAKDAWATASKAFMLGENVLDAGSAIVDAQFANAAPESWLLKLLDAPTRFLMAEDEFFKVLNYRAAVRQRSLAQSAADGITDATLIAQRVEDDLAGAFTGGGQGIDPVALEYAKEATHTRRLTSQTGQLIEQAGNIPGVRIIAPFIRTPTNILKYAWERTPGLNLLSKEVRADLAAGGVRANRRLAQVNASNAMMKFVAMGAISGQITGAGPKNRKLRKQLLDSGWKPYSFKLADGSYVSYRRGDPVTSHVGLIADFVELTGGGPEEEANELAAAMALATISAASSKTFMQGVVQFTDLLGTSATEVEWKRFTSSLVTSTLVPSVVRQLNGDDTLRETRGLADQLRNSIPGQAENLEPQRNVFGEPTLQPPGYFNKTLNPFTYSPGSRVDTVQEQLVNLGKSLQTPGRWLGQGRTIDMADRTQWNADWQKLSAGRRAARELSGDLPQSPYDYMMERMGTTKLGGYTLREAVTTLMQSPQWASVEQAPGDYPGGLRHSAVQAMLGQYRTAALQQTLNEYPLLRSAYARERTNAWLAKNTTSPKAAIAENRGLFAQVDSALAGTGPAQPSQQVQQIVSTLLQQ